MFNRFKFIAIFIFAFVFFAFIKPSYAQTPISPQPNTKIAFFGDSGMGTNFKAVLQMIENEGTDGVVHLGDFDYLDNPQGFHNAINSILPPTFPYILVPGNHDSQMWESGCNSVGGNGCYANVFAQRYATSGIPLTLDQLNSRTYKLDFQGVGLYVVGDRSGRDLELYETFLQNELPQDNHVWKICAWHKNQNSMQVGGKTDEMGWITYDSCLNAGAIIATAHEHTYHRTKTLTQLHGTNDIVVNSLYPDPNLLYVYPGSSFVFVSGLGGNSIRNQERCLPTSYPYGCNGEWAKIYASNQQAKYGALFIEFNYQGDPYLAHGYFKNVDGEIVDDFLIHNRGQEIPFPSPIPSTSPSSSTSPSPSAPTSWDLNSDGKINGYDFVGLVKGIGTTYTVKSNKPSSCRYILDTSNPFIRLHYLSVCSNIDI